MGQGFRSEMEVRWSDVDQNGHMKNAAYLDFASNVRMQYFQSLGFRPDDFAKHGIGPVVFHDDLRYFRESHLLEVLTVNLFLAGLSEDKSKFRMRNQYFRADGKLAAQVTSSGGWLDLRARKVVSPPEALLRLITGLPHSEDFDGLMVRPGSS